MSDQIRKPRKRRVLAVGVAAVAVAVPLAVPSPAQAAIWWPAPPTCSTTNGQWVLSGSALALAQYAYKYEQMRFYGGGYEVRTIHVYDMQQFSWWAHGMISVGRSEKVCGTRWVPWTA